MRSVVVVPTFNERQNLPVLLDRLLRIPELRVLVVDDDSPDGTGAIADQHASDHDRISVLHRRGKRGLGRSYVDGLMRALDDGATHVCQMDADLSHDPCDVPRLIEACADAELAIGSRYVPGGRVQNWARHRVLLSRFANAYVRLVTGLPVRDCTSGFRCWRRDLLTQIDLPTVVSEGYSFQVEMAWRARATGGRIREVPIAFIDREQGASKLSKGVILESMLLPWRLRASGERGRIAF